VPREKQRTPELRDRVLQTAVAMLADEGVSGFTTRKVARSAATSIPAVYELFGDKAGLVREIFFEGFRQLHEELGRLEETADPRADLLRLIESFRSFVRANPVLAEVMFGRPFADFDANAEEITEGVSLRSFFVGRVRRCIDAGVIAGEPTDIAHVLLALAQGLLAQETAGWLGRSRTSVNRRWRLAFDVALSGLAPGEQKEKPIS
jgi:AcrR family transcriptional regulator